MSGAAEIVVAKLVAHDPEHVLRRRFGRHLGQFGWSSEQAGEGGMVRYVSANDNRAGGRALVVRLPIPGVGPSVILGSSAGVRSKRERAGWCDMSAQMTIERVAGRSWSAFRSPGSALPSSWAVRLEFGASGRGRDGAICQRK